MFIAKVSVFLSLIGKLLCCVHVLSVRGVTGVKDFYSVFLYLILYFLFRYHLAAYMC